MYSKYLFFSLLALFTLFAPSAYCDDVTMQVKPKQCVSLQQGDACFAKVSIQWQAPLGSYCVRDKQEPDNPWHCWQDTNQGQLKTRVEIKKDLHLELYDKQSNHVLEESKIRITWVYKKSNRPVTSWRMF